MRDDLEMLINRVAATLPAVDWASPEEIRRNARTYRRRRVVIIGLALIVGLGGGGGAAVSVMADEPPRVPLARAAAPAACPDGLIPVTVALPDEPQIRLQLFNTTSRPEVGRDAAAQLELRGFRVESGDWVVGDGSVGEEAIVLIRYGPRTVGAAWVVRAYFANEARAEFDPSRPDDVVDVVLGERYQSIVSRPEVNRYIAMLGPARPPTGTCAIEDLD